MSQEIRHIIIKHLSGGKENQIEEFDYQANDSINFGRATHSDLLFDSEEDNAVSREHGKITKGDTAGSFFITDHNSLNGTFVNGQKISGTQALHPGDEVMLGAKGPRFLFDINPRLQNEAATQLIDLSAAAATREMQIEEPEAQGKAVKQGIGQQTFERAIVGERKRSQKTMLSIIGGIVLVLGALGYTFKDSLMSKQEIVKVLPGKETTIIETFSPETIAKENTDKVVFIEFGFKLIHTGTGDDIYHQYSLQKNKKTGKNELYPLYIEVESGIVEPYLGLKKDVEYGAAIAMSGATASGFIVDEKGFILTNRHVAAAWQSYYTFPESAATGLLYRYVGGEWKIVGTVDAPTNWVPSESKFFGQKPLSGKIIEGVNTYMDVTFAKTDLRTPAKRVRVSNTHDVAMIKIDLPGELTPVEMSESDKDVAQGQKIAVMGYPGLSPEVAVAKISQDFANRQTQYLTVPDPTITDGTIGKIIRGSNASSNLSVGAYHSMLGDYYQLTVSATGAGNSGGPVFDQDGKVIGIFSASKTSTEGARVTFAIPIKYGFDLMSSQQVIR